MSLQDPRRIKPGNKDLSALRITGGFLKGRKIAVREKSGVRYTSSKVREAVFNILGNVEGKKLLDLYAGAGSLTIEALSRGASSATCVEIDREMAGMLAENLVSLDLNNCCHVVIMDVIYAIPFLSKKASYDIVFIDPPYEKGYIRKTMELLKTCEICDADTLVVIEHSKRERQEVDSLDGWHHITSKGYGDTAIAILQAG